MSESTPSDVPPTTPPAASEPGAVPPPAAPEGAPQAEAAAAPLPEWEPLTPEIVEEEALRGDFVMQWAVVLLAVLFGSHLISDSATLVHVKSGQYLASHGVLPPANDIFSYTATTRPWVNLSWLFDLLVAGVYGVGGFIALSGFKALVCGVIFCILLSISRPGISNWWASVCTALAVVACHPRLLVQPELITLLATATLLWLLWTWQNGGAANRLWALIPLTVLWVNLDPRAWLGPTLLICYGLGDLLGKTLGSPSFATSEQRRLYWYATAGTVGGLLLNPFGWKSWLAPVTQYGDLYPAIRLYTGGYAGSQIFAYPLWSSNFWAEWSVSMIAALVMLVLAPTLWALNSKKRDFGQLVMWIGVLLLGICAAQQLTIAVLVGAVVAVLNGQAWYASRFRLEYTTETRDLMFSRGGRAVTVLAFFALALAVTIGRVRPVGGAPIGWGMQPEMAGIIDSYQQVLADSLDDRPFNLLPAQGDYLIWVNQKCFIDQRYEIYTGTGKDDLTALHRTVRDSLRKEIQPGRAIPAEIQTQKEVFDQYKLTHVIPRLSGANPDYITFALMMDSTRWVLTRVGSATATFYRIDLPDPKYREYLVQNQFDFGLKSLRSEGETIPPHTAWPQLPTFYERYIWGPEQDTPAEVREANHLVLIANISSIPRPELAFLAIRRAQAGLAKNPRDGDAYALLGASYSYLRKIDQLLLGPQASLAPFHYMQAVQAFNLALVADPDRANVRRALGQLYLENSRVDLAFRDLSQLNEALASKFPLTDEDIQVMTQNRKTLDQIQEEMKRIEKDAEAYTKSAERPPVAMAAFYAEKGMLLRALNIIEDLPESDSRNPQVMTMRAQLLLECGRIEDAYALSLQLEPLGQQYGLGGWQEPRCLTMLANAEYSDAAALWNRFADSVQQMSAIRVMTQLIPQPRRSRFGPWPIELLVSTRDYFEVQPQQKAAFDLRTALIYMEAGQAKRAITTLRNILKHAPETSERMEVIFYLNRMTGEDIDPTPPSDRIPVLFAAEEPTAEK